VEYKSTDISIAVIGTGYWGKNLVRNFSTLGALQIIVDTMKEMTDDLKVNLILTTGGTGFSPRDHTPEATLEVIDRIVPGIPEAMRYYSLQITQRAMLSRAVAGIRKSTLIINLPGSPKAVKENLESIIDSVSHGLDILLEYDAECGVEVND